MTELTINSRVNACCIEEENQRYALESVLGIPRQTGGAWLISTDGACLSVVIAKGQLDGRCLIPAAVFRGELPLTVWQDADGKWRSDRGESAAPVEARYPNVAQVFTERIAPVAGTCINARLLRKLQAATRYFDDPEPRGVSFMVTSDTEGVAILGEHGFGLLMPVVRGNDYKMFEESKRQFDAWVAEFKADYSVSEYPTNQQPIERLRKPQPLKASSKFNYVTP